MYLKLWVSFFPPFSSSDLKHYLIKIIKNQEDEILFLILFVPIYYLFTEKVDINLDTSLSFYNLATARMIYLLMSEWHLLKNEANS